MHLKEGWTDLSKDQLVDIISSAINSNKLSNKLNDDTSNNTSTNINTSSQIISPKEKSPIRFVENNLPFALPIDMIIKKLNEIQNLASLLGNKDKKLNNWNISLLNTCDNILQDLLKDKEKLTNDFIKSLETITKIFSITSKFSPIESINESVLTPTIRKLILDYKSNSFKNLENYCNEDLSMFELNKDVEKNLIRLIPILSQQLLSFNKQLKLFYSLYELIDDKNNQIIDISFLNNLPTKSDISLFNEINEAIDIKLILQTNFNKINPDLIEKLDLKIISLKDYINQRIEDLKILIISVINLNNELFIPSDQDFLKLPSYIDQNDLILSKIGIKDQIFDEYNSIFNELQNIKNERELLLNDYLIKVEQLWSILRPNSNEIQSFLKKNKNIKLKSLENFKILLNELEIEKLANIKKFINLSREKIKGFWDILMYDDESKLNFKDYYIDNEDYFNEDLLNSHTNELNRLRNESENLKPLLNMIAKLDDLMIQKRELDESSKDPSRLLKRNSFKILKQEEITRNRLQKELPKLLNEIRIQINQFETDSGRVFKLNGELYLNKIEEIENSFLHKKRNIRSSFKSPTISPNIRNNNLSSTNKYSKNLVTPSRSIIRRRDPTQMSNPFLSRNPTPSRTNSINTPSISKRNKLLSTNSSKKLPLSSDSLSNEPIILRGRSPVKSSNFTLDLNASTKINTNNNTNNNNDTPAPIKSPNFSSVEKTNSITRSLNKLRKSPNVIKRSPMSMISNTFSNNNDNEHNQFTIFSNSNKDSTSTNRSNKKVNLLKTQNNLNNSNNLIPVEELSDSILDYSDNEDDKENHNNNTSNNNNNNMKMKMNMVNELKQKNNFIKNELLSFTTISKSLETNDNHASYNLSLDSDTF